MEDKINEIFEEMEENGFLEILKSTDADEIESFVMSELAIDIVDLRFKREVYKKTYESNEEFLYLLIPYISKYSLILYKFELMEAYEHCKRILHSFKMMLKYIFEVSDQTIDKIINESLIKYKEQNPLNNDK